MSSNPFKTPQFKAQAKIWNKKLIDNGHEEIEDFSLPDPPLKRWHALDFKKVDLTDYNAKLVYFEKARAILHTHFFFSSLHRKIWELHSEGVSVREIARIVNQRKVKKSTVYNILKQIKKDIK